MERLEPFGAPGNQVVVTTSYITSKRDIVREVSHQYDEEDGDVWQFHSGNGDYAPSVIQLVALEQLLRLAPSLRDLPEIPRGWIARRRDESSPWKLEREV